MTEPLTKAERTELASIIRMRAKLARADVDSRKAELLAQVEADLARQHVRDHPKWKELTAEAEATVRRLDAELAARCAEMGLRSEFRPSMHLTWYRRGENADSERRAELRKVAVTRLDAMARDAKLQIERQEVEARTAISATALTSAEAMRWLDALPSVAALMPAITMEALESSEVTT